ncbi:MAG: cell division FtsZ family protein [Verrucomicrobia bacterium]|jgi:cell division protein FtsZ|nr:cell division FtsZ family protein [Verrucomicrobiota bacterium]
MDNPLDHTAPPGVPRIKIIGVGGAGLSILNRLIQAGLDQAHLAAVSTDAALLATSLAGEKLLLESKRLRGLGTGGDPVRGAKAAEENLSKLKPLCQDAEIVFVIAGLGGGTGTGVSPVIARVARQAGALVAGFVVLPFECEGDTRSLNAARGLEALKAAADAVICLPNQKILKLIDEHSSVATTFDKAGALLAEGAQAVWRLIRLKGPMELTFEDLAVALKDRHSENLFAVAEGSGAERIAQVLERLRAHPLLEEGRGLEGAEAVLVSVVSGPELSMADINRLMSELSGSCPRARVAMGVALSDEFASRVSVTVIAACRPRGHREAAAPAETVSRPAGTADEESDELFPRLLSPEEAPRTAHPRFVPPPPDIPLDRLPQAAARRGSRRKTSARLRQGQLPLEVVSKGRFEKGEPTVLHGEDLDMPTYVRRGVALN